MKEKIQVVARTYPPDEKVSTDLEVYLSKGYHVMMCNQIPYVNKNGYCLEYILEKER